MRALKQITMLSAILLLVGCASAPNASSSNAPSTTASPSSTEAAIPETGPTSRLGLTCGDVLPAEIVAQTVQVDMVVTDLMADPSAASPLSYAVSQLGGVSCQASVGVTTVQGGAETGYSSVAVQVLPEASAHWLAFQEKTPP